MWNIGLRARTLNLLLPNTASGVVQHAIDPEDETTAPYDRREAGESEREQSSPELRVAIG